MMGGRGVEGSMRGGSIVLLRPDSGQSAPHRTRMGSALIWKGGGVETSRPLTCSYSFASSSRRPPTDRLKTQASVSGSGRLGSKISSRGGAPKQQASTSRVNEEELETILCIDDERARCSKPSLASRSCTVDCFSLGDDDLDRGHEGGGWGDGGGDEEEAKDSPSRVKRLSQDGPSPCAPLPCSENDPKLHPSPSPPKQPSSWHSPVVGPKQVTPCQAGAPGRSIVDPELDLKVALAGYDVDEGCIEPLKALGVRKISDLVLLTPEDLSEPSLGINILQRRLLKTAINKEKVAAEKRAADTQRAAGAWARMTDDRGWYPLPFSREPPGLRLTVLEPVDLAGTVIDASFGKDRTSLCEAASRTDLDEDGYERFELKLSLGRADRTDFDAAKGNLNFGVVGVSRSHAEIVLMCGDGAPCTLRVRDVGSTNGTFLIRPAGANSLLSSQFMHEDESSTDTRATQRPDTPSGRLMEHKLDASFWSDAAGCPYLRLGPRLVVGLSLLKCGADSCFNFAEAAMTTERLYTEPELRRLGWQDANLEHVVAAKRRKERVGSMLSVFASGSRAVARALSIPAPTSQSAPPGQPIRSVPQPPPLPAPAVKEGGHVFLSYQWDIQHVVLAVAEELKRRGYRVWIDLEQMRGEMNQRMAEAVEGAAIVCPFISRQYKKSPNCMKELNYADQLGKTFLPIIADDSDRGELLKGQVGIITSNLIYIDFSRLPSAIPKNTSEAPSEEVAAMLTAKMGELERALGTAGKATPLPSVVDPLKVPTPPSSRATLLTPRQQASPRRSLDSGKASLLEAPSFSPDGKNTSPPSLARGISGTRSSLGVLPAIV